MLKEFVLFYLCLAGWISSGLSRNGWNDAECLKWCNNNRGKENAFFIWKKQSKQLCTSVFKTCGTTFLFFFSLISPNHSCLLNPWGILTQFASRAVFNWRNITVDRNNDLNTWFDGLNEKKKNSYCTCGTFFDAVFWRNLPNADVQFSFCREAVCCENAL